MSPEEVRTTILRSLRATSGRGSTAEAITRLLRILGALVLVAEPNPIDHVRKILHGLVDDGRVSRKVGGRRRAARYFHRPTASDVPEGIREAGES